MNNVLYKVRVNRPCRLFIDDNDFGILDECLVREYLMPPGQYMRKVVSLDARWIEQEDVIGLSGESMVDNIVLDTVDLMAAKMRALHGEKVEGDGLTYEKASSDDGVCVFECDDDDMTYVEIPEQIRVGHYLYDVVEISGFSFVNNKKLQHVVIPNTVKVIGECAFDGCEKLATMHIPSSVVKIDEYAFCGCAALTSLVIPSSVGEIGEYAFSDCKKMMFLTIEEGVTAVGEGVFSDCVELVSVTIPKSLDSISDFMFSGCTTLGAVTIPEGVYEIGHFAFRDCKLLKYLTIPDSVDNIGREAFPQHTKVERVVE